MLVEFLSRFRKAFLIFALLFVGGCAASNLTSEVNRIERPFEIENDTNEVPTLDVTEKNAVSLANATAYAYSMSEAFRKAGNQSAAMQDAFSFLVAGAAAATVIGAIDEIAQERLARTAVTGTALFSLQRNGLSQGDIDALYVGAQRSNCIALASAIRQSDTSVVSSDALVTVFYVREVELRARLSLVNDVVSFEQFVALFRSATQNLIGGRSIDFKDSYIATLDKCLEIEPPDRSAAEGSKPQTANDDESDGENSSDDTSQVSASNTELPEGAIEAANVVSGG